MTPMNEGILDGIFFYFNFYDRKLSSATRNSCTFPHCLTSGQYGRAINQTKIRQVRRSATYQFGYLNPRDYKHALELDKINGNSRWYDATKKELDQINEYQVFLEHGIAKYDLKSKRITNAPQGYQKIKVHVVFACKHDGHHKTRLPYFSESCTHHIPAPTHTFLVHLCVLRAYSK